MCKKSVYNTRSAGDINMSEKAAAARREYQRKWAKENPEKIREYQKRYWIKKAEQAEAQKK